VQQEQQQTLELESDDDVSNALQKQWKSGKVGGKMPREREKEKDSGLGELRAGSVVQANGRMFGKAI